MRGSTITGIGRYVPRRVMTNHELEKIVETTDEWIVSRTGIRERRIAAPEEASSDLAFHAAQEALADAGVSPEQIDLIIVGTATPDMLFPATACILQDRLGSRNAGAFDVSAACSSWGYAAAVAHGYVASGLANTVLVVGAEVLSKFVNWKDRNTCVLFGDSAGAAVLRPCEQGRGFLSFYLGADGSGGSLIAVPGGGSRIPASYDSVEQNLHVMQMNGREVYKFAVRCIPKAIEEAVQRAHVTIEDVDWFIPHQANIRIIDAAAERLGQPREKFFINVERYGNTSSASVPVALYEAVRTGRLKEGDLAVLVAFGGGLTWGSCAVRWTMPTTRDPGSRA